MAKVQKGEVTKRIKVSADEFVRAWQASDTADEVSQKLGIAKLSVLVRASNYRKRGINLKKLQRSGGADRLNPEALNKLIEELG